MKNIKLTRNILFTQIIIVAAILVACGAAPPPAGTGGGAAPGSPASMTLTAAAGGSFPFGTYLSGEGSEWTFDEDFTLSVAQADGTTFDGTFDVEGDLFTVQDSSSTCGSAGSGSYNWSYEEPTLTFEKLTDGCSPRADDLLSVLTRQDD